MPEEQQSDASQVDDDSTDQQQQREQSGKDQEFSAEYVSKLRAEAADYRKKAKANADAAKRLAEIEQANKTDAEKAAERIAELQKEAESAKAETLRFKAAARFGISDEDADLFLTGTDEATLTRQAERLAERNADSPKQGNHAPFAGKQSRPPKDDRQALADYMTGRTR